MLRILFFGIILAFTSQISAQKSVNDYKYVVIPEQYSFFKQADKYQLNSLTKFLFNKNGFKALVRGENFPEDLTANGCKALQADLIKKSGVFTTGLIVELKDCNGNVIFTSPEGKSREKEFKKAFQEALRNAFNGVTALNYSYNENSDIAAVEDKPSTPEIAVSQKPVNTEKIKEEKDSKKVASEKETTYKLNGDSFIFKKSEYGFELFKKQDNTAISIGKIFKMSIGESYLLSAGDYSGGGSFDAYGNFVLERINPATNNLIVDVLARQ